MTFDLDAYRCPCATIYMRRAIEAFEADTESDTHTLISIEPSLERSIRHFLEGKDDIELAEVKVTDITDAQRERWAENFDEEDHEDVTVSHTFIFHTRRTEG